MKNNAAVQPALPPEEGTGGEERPSSYRVKNVFRTVQGEGFWMGRPAVFVRLVGCNMWSGYETDRERDAERTGADCPLWCDTDFTKEESTTYDVQGVVDAMVEEGGDIRFCVLTGGEPFLQADARLIEALHAAGFQVAVETNGTVSLEEAFWSEEQGAVVPPDWIVCSPKLPEDELALECFDELKLIVPDYQPSAYAEFAERARTHKVEGETVPLLWLQPEDGPRLEQAKRVAVKLAQERPTWRVGVQGHKVLGVA
jgi:organic radical activating enzyme